MCYMWNNVFLKYPRIGLSIRKMHGIFANNRLKYYKNIES